MKPWYERFPERLDYELKALDEANISWTLNQAAKDIGRIEILISYLIDDEKHELIAFFPDLYPYFRIELTAPSLQLPNHQNPFGKNLCLLGRRTHFWDTDRTLASLVIEQLPKVLEAASSPVDEIKPGLEQQQGEPFSNYYQCHPGSMVIIQSDWTIPKGQDSGTFVIASESSGASMPPGLLRGLVVEISDNKNQLIAQADERIRAAFSGQKLTGSWVRAASPINTTCPKEFFDNLRTNFPDAVSKASQNPTSQGQLRICGVLFDEEHGYHTNGDGWVFACSLASKPALSPTRTRPDSFMGNQKQKKRKPKKGTRK